MQNGTVSSQSISIEGGKATEVKVVNSDTRETTVALNIKNDDGTTDKFVSTENTKTGDYAAFSSATGWVNGNSNQFNGAGLGQGTVSINPEIHGLSGTLPSPNAQNNQSLGGQQQGWSQENKQSFGVGSSPAQERFSPGSAQTPIGAPPETIGPRNEREVQENLEAPAPRLEKQANPLEDQPQNSQELLSSMMRQSSEASPPSEAGQPHSAQANSPNSPSSDQKPDKDSSASPGLTNVLNGLKGLAEGYIGISEAAEAWELSAGFLELAAAAEAGSLITLSAVAWPVALGVGAGIGLSIGMAQSTIGMIQVISSFTNSAVDSKTNEAIAEAFNTISVNGMVGFGYGQITNDPAAGRDLGEQLDTFGQFWQSSTSGMPKVSPNSE